MKVLGIETSCDETGASIIENGVQIISNIVASSQEIHIKTGGIIPEEAARQQLKTILPVINEAAKKEDYDAIAVTIGPGLVGSLLVGVETAKTLSYLSQKPVIAVNHLVAHLYANWLERKASPEFPALGLVVSGGHTDLVLVKGHGKITWLGGTRDDAAGEAFDKTARLLGLPYPGGPAIAKEAASYLRENPQKKLAMFPRPLEDEDNLDFSFSGLKTAVMREVKLSPSFKRRRAELAAEIQEAIVDVLISKTLKAVDQYRPKSVLLAGGVAANDRLREKFQNERNSKHLRAWVHVPKAEYCTDNAAMIASAGYFVRNKVDWRNLSANPNLTITQINH